MSSKQARWPHKDLTKGSRHGKKGRIRIALATSVCAFTLGAVALHAQSDGTLARAQVVNSGGQGNCPVLLISFNQDLSIIDQTVTEDGQRLIVRMSDKGSPVARAPGLDQIETEPGLTIPGVGTAFVTLDVSGDQPIMNVSFSSPSVQFAVRQAGARSVIVSLFGTGGGCASGRDTSGGSSVAADQLQPPSTLPEAAADDSSEASGLYAEARAAVTATEYDRAIQILTKLVSLPANAFSADAQEMLGIVRERNGQLAHAKAEYTIYLEKYPDAQGAERVKQRLAAIETAEAAQPGALLPARPGQDYADGRGPGLLKGLRRIVSIPRRNESFPPLRNQPGLSRDGGTVQADGTVRKVGGRRDRTDDPPQIVISLTYYLNQTTTLITELEDKTTESETDLRQNALILSFNISDSFRKYGQIYSYRFSGDYIQDFTDSSQSQLNLSRFYGELSMGLDGPSIAIGRQSWNDDASLGRYDGVRLRGQISDDVRVSGVAGIAVNSKSDPMFSGKDHVLGFSADLLSLGEKTELTGYVLKEFSGSYTDRMVVGAEASFSNKTNSGNGLIEYDMALGKIGTARTSWSHRFQDRSSFTLTADYDHTPNLSLNSALVGQFVTTLDALNEIYTLGEMKDLARDRSAEMFTFSGSWQKPLNDQWQLSVDGTAYHTAGSPASGGVAAVEAPGWSYQLAAQVVGTGIFADDDVFSLSARGADDVSSKLILLDGYWRYNVSDKFRVKPRLKLAHRTFANGTGNENFAIPSITMGYEFNKKSSLEVELGTRLSNRATPGIVEESNDTYFSAGLTKEF